MDRARAEVVIAVSSFLGSSLATALFFVCTPQPFCLLLSPCLAFLSVVIQERLMRRRVSEISIRSSLLGNLFAFGVWTVFVFRSVRPFGIYMALLAHFHWSEYLFISMFSPRSLSVRSFMLDHSPAYVFATIASWIEYTVWQFIFPGMRDCIWISIVGLLMCVVGESLRKVAIATAGENFDHIVEDSKRREHVLITHGVYKICRHPSYLGWWMFAVGTQIVLQNPVCVFGFFYGAYRFFADRVPYEERILIQFFGDQYIRYRQHVPLLLPFIKDPKDVD
ncbi:protein-S-isoprenylcysteine O-methyltransferase-like [Paramacrobiotus metropolitanus]|uniref:protein-S-isoprenylcysteine O-methyltransferase-like n=1 Tax=Paramacrobiotus metropolitanus TaxID=2943436 RepID=UPI002445CAE9|nr:protein-S-isoprenylcysteine O-methyltransferase-like [Paramacrobiotus metropolitanus]XP_055342899.1 protein-S-isoprenylcysteine O-methyltransferase-like [Paramacrobiotus metropolitanus]XP_055342901.1 protein-S-isoprenylcysteine O-methyltransferase-like [Paramacrobiotus metropolitanus]XP_055342902.1 protein-S-isoprenylcysteine O-methyltransferase-like [Paramacrobiotus metropolitanus]